MGSIRDVVGENRMRVSHDHHLRDFVYVDQPHKLSYAYQSVRTPKELSEAMIDKLMELDDLQDKTILTTNIEFVIILSKFVAHDNITFMADSEEKINFVNFYYPGVNIMAGDFLGLDDSVKFDVVVMNPPYQASQEASGKRGGGDVLWPDFVNLAFKLIKDGGHLLSLIHI